MRSAIITVLLLIARVAAAQHCCQAPNFAGCLNTADVSCPGGYYWVEWAYCGGAPVCIEYATSTPTSIPSATPTPSSTTGRTDTPTATPSDTPTLRPTWTPVDTPTAPGATYTPYPTWTSIPTWTPTKTSTITPTPTSTRTATITPTPYPTWQLGVCAENTVGPTPTQTQTPYPSPVCCECGENQCTDGTHFCDLSHCTVAQNAVCLNAHCATMTPTPTATATLKAYATPCPDCDVPARCMRSNFCTANGGVTDNLGMCIPKKGDTDWLRGLSSNVNEIDTLFSGCYLQIDHGGLDIGTPAAGAVPVGNLGNGYTATVGSPYQTLHGDGWGFGAEAIMGAPSNPCDPGRLMVDTVGFTLYLCLPDATWKSIALQ